jgi:hypothetical protein
MFKAQKQKINKLILSGQSTPITIFDFTDSQGKGNIANAAAAKAGIRPLRLQKMKEITDAAAEKQASLLSEENDKQKGTN